MKKLFKIFLVVVMLGVLGVVALLGYFGFIPGVSAVFGSNMPRDLGVRHTEVDFQNVQQKLGQQIIESQGADPYAQLKASAGSPADVFLTQEEYSAHVVRYHPVSDVQIRFDGTSFEMSGRIDKTRIPQFLRTLGVTDADDVEIIQAVDTYLPVSPVFYIRGTGSAVNNDVTITTTRAELGRMPIPADTTDEALEGYMEFLLEQIPAFSMEAVSIEGGQLHFRGTATAQVPEY